MAEEIKQDNNRKQLAIIIGVVLGVVLFFSIALIFLGSDIKENAERVKNARSELLSQSEATESLALLRSQAEQSRSYSVVLESILINRNKLVNFSRDVGAMAKQNRIDLNSSFSGESVSAEGLGKIGLAMSATGPFDGFVQFLKILGNSKYPIKINSIHFTAQGDKIRAQLNGNAFFFELNK